uniref:Uncharacterized protein n=1 Tax=Arundo donax TaxID=35708 RepID=A0A0A9AWP0_ARUDO
MRIIYFNLFLYTFNLISVLLCMPKSISIFRSFGV